MQLAIEKMSSRVRNQSNYQREDIQCFTKMTWKKSDAFLTKELIQFTSNANTKKMAEYN